jgi:hypothetical protein
MICRHLLIFILGVTSDAIDHGGANKLNPSNSALRNCLNTNQTSTISIGRKIFLSQLVQFYLPGDYDDIPGTVDTVKYRDKVSQDFVGRFLNGGGENSRGEPIRNNTYYGPFASIVSRLHKAQENYIYYYNPKGGFISEVTYDGKDVHILITDPGTAFGGEGLGAVGTLFEETKHADQVLDGKTYFEKDSKGNWGAHSCLDNEVEAKMFAAIYPGIKMEYKGVNPNNGKEYYFPTDLGYIRRLRTDRERGNYIKYGVKRIQIREVYNLMNTDEIEINPAEEYRKLEWGPIKNDLRERTKSDKVFGYPKR